MSGLRLFLLTSILLLQAKAQEKAPQAPVAAAPSATLDATRQRLKKISPTEYDLDGIRIHADTREVRLPARVELKKAPIEYALVHETGKTHESILTTAVRPMALQLALLLADYQPATLGMLARVPETERPRDWKEEAPARPGGNRLRIEVEWREDGQTRKAPLAHWVQNNVSENSPPDLDTWIYNGSYTNEQGFIGEHEGSMIAVWLDRGALINSPAQGAWRDDLWDAFSDRIPEEGTPVTVIITPSSAP